MYTPLSIKPFYFLTDRQTNYQFFVDNRNSKQPKKYIYYPEEYEKMSEKKIFKYKKSMIYKFMQYAIMNQQKIQHNDKKIINSFMFDILISIAICAFGAKSLRKILFRTQSPVLQIKLQRMGFNVRLFKTFLSYTVFGWIGYKYVNSLFLDNYLIDLAFQYKYCFGDRMHSKADNLYEELAKKRFDVKQMIKEEL